MNLNFYPTDFNKQNINPYTTLLGLDGSSILQQFQQNAENKLQQLQSQIPSQFTQTQQNTTQQPYYLFCGNKNDWDEFLLLNYNITEQNIFDDYKLFLQAKQEIIQERGQNKIDNMKDKIRNNKTVKIDDAIQSNIKPEQSFIQQQGQQPIFFDRNDSGIVNGYNSESNNRQFEQNKKGIRKKEGK